ncbi:MAG: hypothetical protein ACKN82_17225, partial [Pirellula sp.]
MDNTQDGFNSSKKTDTTTRNPVLYHRSANVADFSKISAQRLRPRRPDRTALKASEVDFGEINRREIQVDFGEINRRRKQSSLTQFDADLFELAIERIFA